MAWMHRAITRLVVFQWDWPYKMNDLKIKSQDISEWQNTQNSVIRTTLFSYLSDMSWFLNNSSSTSRDMRRYGVIYIYLHCSFTNSKNIAAVWQLWVSKKRKRKTLDLNFTHYNKSISSSFMLNLHWKFALANQNRRSTSGGDQESHKNSTENSHNKSAELGLAVMEILNITKLY